MFFRVFNNTEQASRSPRWPINTVVVALECYVQWLVLGLESHESRTSESTCKKKSKSRSKEPTNCGERLPYVAVYKHTHSDEFRMPTSRRPAESKRRATRLRKDLDDILATPPPLLFVPRWFRRKPAKHVIPGGGVIHCHTLSLLSYTVCSRVGFARFDASRRGKKGLKSSRQKHEGVYRSGEGGEEPS